MAGDYFGYSVAVSGSTVLVGAQGKDGCFDAMGSAYVFGRVPPHTLPGDANHDGKVDGGDLAVWQQNYDPLGVGNNTCEMGDFNENGRIDGGDLAIWQQNYDPLGTGGGVIPDPGIKAAVPEPTTLSLLSAIALLLFRPSLRRR